MFIYVINVIIDVLGVFKRKKFPNLSTKTLYMFIEIKHFSILGMKKKYFYHYLGKFLVLLMKHLFLDGRLAKLIFR